MPRGRTGERQAVGCFLAAFPDLRNEIDRRAADPRRPIAQAWDEVDIAGVRQQLNR